MRKTLFTAMALTALAASVATAQDAVRLAARADSKLSIEGTSNLHEWSCQASSIDANVEMGAGYQRAEPSSFARLLQRVSVRVPVGNLRCGHGQMDRNLQKALGADRAPNITYILGNFEVVPGSTPNEYTVKAVGTLTIAGRSNTIRMDVAARRAADGTLRAQGEVPVLMTSFGIQPPTAMLGTLRTGDRVMVKFELVVAPQTTVATAAQP